LAGVLFTETGSRNGMPEEAEETPTVENILAHMSAYMEAPAAA